MRIKIGRTSTGRNLRGSIFSVVTAAICLVVGLLTSSPFIVHFFILGSSVHQIGLLHMAMLVGFLVGMPLIILGVINICLRGRSFGSGSQVDLDLARVRHNTEYGSMTRSKHE